MLTHYSKKIQNVIQKELFKAQKSIKIAVAWFTNDLLFQPLLLKLQTGISVELILNKDEINDSEENDIDLNEFIEQGGKLHWNNSKTLMHDKFCIIDDKVVIFGSYNWTNKAEFNDESIAVSEDEKETIEFYNNLFQKLCSIYPPLIKTIGNIVQKEEKKIADNGTNCNNINQFSLDEGDCIFNNNIIKLYRWFFKGSYLYRIVDANNLTLISSKTFTNWAYSVSDKAKIILLKYEKKWFVFETINKKFDSSYGAFDGCYSTNIRGRFIVYVKNKYGLLDETGKFLVKCKYDKISQCNNIGFYLLNLKGKYGLLHNEEIVFKCEYDELNIDGYHPSILKKKYGLISKDGSIVLDFKYQIIKCFSKFDNYPYSCYGSFIIMAENVGDKTLYGIYIPSLKKKTDCIFKPEILERFDFKNVDIFNVNPNPLTEELRLDFIRKLLYNTIHPTLIPNVVEIEKRWREKKHREYSFLKEHNLFSENLTPLYIEKEHKIDFADNNLFEFYGKTIDKEYFPFKVGDIITIPKDYTVLVERLEGGRIQTFTILNVINDITGEDRKVKVYPVLFSQMYCVRLIRENRRKFDKKTNYGSVIEKVMSLRDIDEIFNVLTSNRQANCIFKTTNVEIYDALTVDIELKEKIIVKKPIYKFDFI